MESVQSRRNRELVVTRIAAHLRGRMGLGVADPEKAARKLIAKRSDAWIDFFLAVSDEANLFKSQRELGALAGLSEGQVKRFWQDLRGMYIVVASGKYRVFRDGPELKNRNHGKEGEERFAGGICLHLSVQQKMNRDLLRTITNSTQKQTEIVASNYREAANEQAQDSESLAERAEIEERRDEVLTGVKAGPSLPLFRTGTDNDGAE
jgi:hypothetical protein